MLSFSTLYTVKIVFVTLCRFYNDMLSYQNIKCLVLTIMGSEFMFGMQLMQLFSENKADFTKLLVILGHCFHIRDDYCNLWLQEVIYDLWFLDSWVCSCVKAWCHECEGVLLWSPVHSRSYLLVRVRCRAERYVKLCPWTKLNYYLKFYFVIWQSSHCRIFIFCSPRWPLSKT
jgi:hypothetical protein